MFSKAVQSVYFKRHITCLVLSLGLLFVLALGSGVNADVLTELLVNNDTTPGSELPLMDYNATSGRMVAVWHGYYAESPGTVWFQILDQDLAKIGDISPVEDDLYSSIWNDAAVAATGDFAIVFLGQVSSSADRNVYIRFFSADGTPKGAAIKVADEGIEGSQHDFSIATDSVGKVLVAWDDGRDAERPSGDIWAQFFSASGVKIGTNIRVSDDQDTCCVGLPGVSMNSSGQAVITWEANQWGAYTFSSRDIRFQRFLADGSKVGTIGTANFPSTVAVRMEPSVSMNQSGSFCIAWKEPGTNAIVAQFYNSLGDPVGDNMRIERAEEPDEPAIALSDDDVAALSWDENYPYRIYYQVFQSTTLSGNVEMVIDSNRFFPSVGISSHDIFFLYQGPDYHIFAAKLSDVATDVQTSETLSMPGDYDLGQNFPNPFNPTTSIQFDLPRRSMVSLTIFNLLGQQVRELIHDEYPAGSHIVTWDGLSSGGQRISSGVYFYRLQVEDFVETRKMILLK